MHKKTVAFLILSLVVVFLSGCKLQTSLSDDQATLDRLKTQGKAGPAPKFAGELFSGKKVALADYRGKPLVINFWASWCPPCRGEQPDFVKAHEKFGDRVQFLGINFRDSEAPAAKFMRDFKVNYESIYDPSGRIGFKYGVKALPATFFVDAQGKIIRREIGGVTKKNLLKGIDQLLKTEQNAS